MLRALFVIAIILFGIRMSMRGPFYALLLYLWWAYFRPDYWLWYDFVSQLNLSLFVGIIVLVGTVFSGRKLQFGNGAAFMLLMAGQGLISTIFSPAFSYSFPYWQDFAKSTIISVLLVTLVDDEKKLRTTLGVIALSLGLEATKQGWATFFRNPGGANYNDHAALGDNNSVAVGMLMLVAFMVALARTTPLYSKYETHLFRFMSVGCLYRSISTYSRGGFLALGAFGIHYLVFSKKKLQTLAGVAIVALLIYPVLPQAFWDRMNTIPTGTEEIQTSEDNSTRTRLHFWRVAIAMANANPFTGIGHNAYNVRYNEYDFLHGQYGRVRSVHSSWFGVLAEYGYLGLFLFVGIIANAFITCRRAQHQAKRHPELKNLGAFANGIERALVAFVIGGSFVIFQYTEMLWHTLALSIVVGRLVRERAAALAASPQHAMAVTTPAALPAFNPVRPSVAARKAQA